MSAFIDTDKTISAETCPQCANTHPVNLGDFYHCQNCGLRWFVGSPDLDVTEVAPNREANTGEDATEANLE